VREPLFKGKLNSFFTEEQETSFVSLIVRPFAFFPLIVGLILVFDALR
jgi:hypothetical protein